MFYSGSDGLINTIAIQPVFLNIVFVLSYKKNDEKVTNRSVFAYLLNLFFTVDQKNKELKKKAAQIRCLVVRHE